MPINFKIPELNKFTNQIIGVKTFIKSERRKELCFEGQRWFDLRRYGMPQIIHRWGEQVYTLKQNDPSYTMPIPDAVLIKNKKLEQNPLAPKREN